AYGRRCPSAGRWHTVVCIASGPSLTADDCAAVKAWRKGEKGRGVIVTNTTLRMVPWADVLYAMDKVWWDQYGEEAEKTFTGERWAPLRYPGVRREIFNRGKNSGVGAISLAAHWGARRIILLG